MTVLKAHFDGTSIILDEPVRLKPNTKLSIFVAEEEQNKTESITGDKSDLCTLFGEPFDTGIDDLAEQHDHYLYGTPKCPRE